MGGGKEADSGRKDNGRGNLTRLIDPMYLSGRLLRQLVKDQLRPLSKAKLRPVWKNALLVSFAIFAAMSAYVLLPESCSEPQRRMAAIFVLALVLWVTEGIPLFATALVVIILMVYILVVPHDLPEEISYKVIFGVLGSPTIYLLLGGFILAKAVQKERIDVQMAGLILRLFGNTPKGVLAGVMAATACFSMWMSNTATTAMMIVLIAPMLKKIPAGERYRVALVLAVPFSANIGGIGTVIGTPPNAIAAAVLAARGLEIGFLTWMAFAVPLMLLALGGLWLFFVIFFGPRSKEIVIEVPTDFKLTFRAAAVYGTFALTVAMWMTSPLHHIDTAIVAGIPMVLLTASGLIGRRDFNTLDWDVLVLIAGGLALGIGITRTGLDVWFVESLPLAGMPFFLVLAACCAITMAMATVMSNTASTNIMLPIGLTIATALGRHDVKLQVVGILVALSASFAMSLPVSTPPNTIAYGTGQVERKHFFLVGGMVSALTLLATVVAGPYVVEFVLKRFPF